MTQSLRRRNGSIVLHADSQATDNLVPGHNAAFSFALLMPEAPSFLAIAFR
jgi:hypothetical protein